MRGADQNVALHTSQSHAAWEFSSSMVVCFSYQRGIVTLPCWFVSVIKSQSHAAWEFSSSVLVCFCYQRHSYTSVLVCFCYQRGIVTLLRWSVTEEEYLHFYAGLLLLPKRHSYTSVLVCFCYQITITCCLGIQLICAGLFLLPKCIVTLRCWFVSVTEEE